MSSKPSVSVTLKCLSYPGAGHSHLRPSIWDQGLSESISPKTMARISVSNMNTEADIEALIAAVREISKSVEAAT